MSMRFKNDFTKNEVVAVFWNGHNAEEVRDVINTGFDIDCTPLQIGRSLVQVVNPCDYYKNTIISIRTEYIGNKYAYAHRHNIPIGSWIVFEEDEVDVYYPEAFNETFYRI